MAIKKTPRALIAVFDAEGKITNWELEVFVTYEAEAPDDPMVAVFQPQVKRELISAEETASFLKQSNDGLLDENKRLHQQIAVMQEAAAAAGETTRAQLAVLTETVNRLTAQKTEAEAKLGAVRAALGG